jgi:hypothetical protein
VSELARDLKPLLETLPQSALSADGVKWIQQLIAWDLAMVSIYPPSSRLPECCLGR